MPHLRMVRASPGTGFPNLGSNGSYTPSTRRNGLSDRQDILGRIYITVVLRFAPWTCPLAHTQRERIQLMPTAGAQFATRKEAVDLHDRFSLRFNQANCSPDRGIRERTGQAVVLSHAPEMQIFNVDGVKPSRQHRAQFMQAITPGVGDLFVQAGDAAALRQIAVRPSLLPGHSTLRTSQQDSLASKVTRVGNRLAIRQGGQAGHAEVNADRLTGLDPFHGGDLHDHRDVVPTGWMPSDRHRAGIDLDTAADRQLQDTELRERQPLRGEIEPKGAFSIFGAVPDAAFFLEGGVSATLGEKIDEGGLQVTKGLLQGNTRDLVQKGQIGIFLEASQLCAGPDKSQSFAALKGHGSGSQHAVVDQTATTKRPRQVFGLRRCRVGSEGPTAFHGLIINALAIEVKSPIGTHFLPLLHEWVSVRGIL